MTRRDDCQHKRGDFIPDMGFWLCSGCWQRLANRPHRFGMTATPKDWVFGGGGRQDVVWQAEIHTDQHGNTLGAFLRAMVKRFQFKTRPKMDHRAAYDLSISVLQTIGDDFGDPAYDWSPDGAREFADEEIQYFDEVTGGNG